MKIETSNPLRYNIFTTKQLSPWKEWGFMKNIISNSNEKIKCPRCNSHKIYKFGKDPKTGNQKYQCQNCKYQSTF